MKKFFIILSFAFLANSVQSQADSARLVNSIKEFHQALVDKNTISVNQHTDKALSYGHSNGWIETKNEMLNNLETGYIKYNSITEDSMRAVINGTIAHARFVCDYNVTMNGNTNTYRLKVMEIWVKKGKRWVLFARQAVK